MPQRIVDYCKKTGQRVPETHGQIILIALESLAMRYRRSVIELSKITGKKIDVLHIVGGGCKNDWVPSPDGPRNYYCASFRMLFEHAGERMAAIARAERRARAGR